MKKEFIMSKILTITIPAYNVEKYMDEVLPTFLAESIMDKIEILIVNDGSKDKTSEIGKRYETEYPGVIRLIDKENGGHGSTINKGIELATGKYFKVVDGDDWVDTDAFVTYVTMLEKLDTDAVATSYHRVNEVTKEKELNVFNGIAFGKEYQLNNIINQMDNKYQMHGLTFKTEILKKIPKISEHCFYVDQEYVIYPLKYVETIYFLDAPIYQYRVGNVAQSVSTQSYMKNREMHKRVTRNILHYYQSETLSDEKKSFLKKRVSQLINTQLRIYLSFKPSKEIKAELLDFYHEMKNVDEELINMMPGKIFKLLKIGDCSLYYFIAAYYSKGEHVLG